MKHSVKETSSVYYLAPAPVRYVVDASVGIKLFIQDELSEKAHLLFSHLSAETPAELFVPDLFYIECTNVLWKYVRWGGLELETARADLSDLARLALFTAPTSVLIEKALDIAVERSITAYDACYIALAQQLGVPLVTADEKLANRLPETLWLGILNLSSAG